MFQVSFLLIKWFLLRTGYIYFFVKFKYYAWAMTMVNGRTTIVHELQYKRKI